MIFQNQIIQKQLIQITEQYILLNVCQFLIPVSHLLSILKEIEQCVLLFNLLIHHIALNFLSS